MMVVTDGVSVPRFDSLILWSSVPSSIVTASGKRASAVSGLVDFAHEGRRVREGVDSLSLPAYHHLG